MSRNFLLNTDFSKGQIWNLSLKPALKTGLDINQGPFFFSRKWRNTLLSPDFSWLCFPLRGMWNESERGIIWSLSYFQKPWILYGKVLTGREPGLSWISTSQNAQLNCRTIGKCKTKRFQPSAKARTLGESWLQGKSNKFYFRHQLQLIVMVLASICWEGFWELMGSIWKCVRID